MASALQHVKVGAPSSQIFPLSLLSFSRLQLPFIRYFLFATNSNNTLRTTMADNYGSRYFDFFGLSRELRDAIYDNLLSDSTLLRTGDDLSGFSFLAKGTVDTNFLLVSRLLCG